MEKESLSKRLIDWFSLHRRPLPWREKRTPYLVWVSEVMLQQTRVSVVIPYFHRWMERFPSIEALAHASIEEVIKTWEGLGYYARARNLHRGARHLLRYHRGRLPDDRSSLEKIPGLGPYTAGAILSFAFGRKAAAVDSNAARVISRYLGIGKKVDAHATRKIIEERVLQLLPDREPAVAMEALIELGATLCRKKPQCPSCPLCDSCLAFRENRVGEFPKKGDKKPLTQLYRCVALVRVDRALLVLKRRRGQIMADLWEFPYLPMEREGESPHTLQKRVERFLGMPLTYLATLPRLSHTFTRYRALLYPLLWRTPRPTRVSGPEEEYRWVPIGEIGTLPFSSGHRKLLPYVAQLEVPDS